jgi:protein-S-isoprenylcysteine O-methyltransferase Ste14
MPLRSLSILSFLLMALSGLALYYHGGLFSDNPVVIAVQLAALALMIWARITFGRRSFHAAANPTEGGLVTNGPYRFIRHPIYSAVLYAVWAGALAHFGLVNILLALACTLGGVIRMLIEERLIVLRYPAYADYARRTRRIIPFIL